MSCCTFVCTVQYYACLLETHCNVNRMRECQSQQQAQLADRLMADEPFVPFFDCASRAPPDMSELRTSAVLQARFTHYAPCPGAFECIVLGRKNVYNLHSVAYAPA